MTSAERTRKRRQETIDPSVPGDGSLTKKARTDLGLALLSLAGKPGIQYSRDEIAAWCGCTDTAILAIEERALRRLRHRLFYMKDPRLVQAMESYFDRRTAARKREFFA